MMYERSVFKYVAILQMWSKYIFVFFSSTHFNYEKEAYELREVTYTENSKCHGSFFLPNFPVSCTL